MLNTLLRLPFFLLPLALCLAGDPAAAQDWKPSRNIDIIVSSGPGGAADREARETQKFLQEQNAWGADFRASAETRKHLDAELVSLRKILADLGVTASTQ